MKREGEGGDSHSATTRKLREVPIQASSGGEKKERKKKRPDALYVGRPKKKKKKIGRLSHSFR